MRRLWWVTAWALGGVTFIGCGGAAYTSTGDGGGSGSPSSGAHGQRSSGASGQPSSGASGTTSSGVNGSGSSSAGAGSGLASTGASPSGGGGGSGACVGDADCPSGGVCGYPVAAACSVTGACFPAPGVACDAYSPGCACDGSEINITCTGLPSGYTSKPLLHSGVCTSVVDSGLPADSSACVISASSFDQSCTVDTDCWMVSSGDYCSKGCLCGGSAVNTAALVLFNEAVSKTPLGMGAFGDVVCGCPLLLSPCCRHGVCQEGFSVCSVPADN